MKNLMDIDKNFAFESKLEMTDIKFHNALGHPFSLHGVFYEDDAYRRMPEAVAATVNDGVLWGSRNTAGGRVRFRTDSPYIAIHAQMPFVGFMAHCALTGSACFDLYIRDETGRERFVDSFKRMTDNQGDYEAVIYPGLTGMQEYTVNFPTYSNVECLHIGLTETAKVEPPMPYKIQNPVVFYGSSITQGGCSSRPGTTYQAIASRRLDFDYINLGFSGAARGEQTMADYLASLEMSCFVCDYDHNAPTVEHLAQTHENLFQTVRKAHPDIPVIFMARPQYYPNAEVLERLAVIQKTYENARTAGDHNVYLLDGKTLMAIAGDDGRVDGAHPNDLGFGSMAKAVGDVLEEIYG